MFKSLICWSVAFLGSDAILAALDIDSNIFRDPSNIGNFAIRLGVVLALYFLTDCDQYVMEGYLRHRFTPKVQFTPGFQVIFDPSLNPDDDVIGVFEFRVRVVF